ncbi:N-acetylneuraminate synthase family protein [Fluviispira vulneris]|uniref:N-acetylneuraminate synthase family protein n=1 Tax=Fluviispira vulneris TaxID=2763012 RepID=UPI001C97F39D|nr:N-acetylneuraminate synthase family protein [Fluviispira vulneris]
MFKIGNRSIGKDFPPLVIAEVGINHDGDLNKAIAMVDSAFESGAEVIKFQCHITEKEMIKTDILPGEISKEPLWNIIKRCELTEIEELKIKKYCDQKGIMYLSTPFSREASDRLEKMDVPAYKIGSGECNNLPLIEYIAAKGKPIILSTGMNDIESIRRSVNIISKYSVPLILLHCTSMYPTPYKHVRLGAIDDLKANFPNIEIGLSDHSLNIYCALGAVAIGACILEKHFTLSKDWEGPDISISITPFELKELVNGSRAIWEARGGRKSILEEEKPVIDFAYASVATIAPIRKDDVFSIENIWVKRPGLGEIPASDFENIIGKKALNDIPNDIHLKLKDVSQ